MTVSALFFYFSFLPPLRCLAETVKPSLIVIHHANFAFYNQKLFFISNCIFCPSTKLLYYIIVLV